MKNTKKILLGLGATAAVATPIVATVSCSLFGGSKGGAKSSRQFWNYEAYIQDNDDNSTDPSSIKNQVDAAYEYNMFGELTQFKTNIVQGGVVGGIGSDYFNARLAEEGLIQKIDFSRLFGITPDKSQWETELQKLYTPQAWQLLDSINLDNLNKDEVAKAEADLASNKIDKATHDSILHDVDHDGIEDKLWEYMAPYFMQNKVFAVNLEKLDQTELGKAFPNAVDQATQKVDFSKISAKDFNDKYKGKTYSETFDELKTLGVKNFTVNDYMRDNMMIGSESSNAGFTSKPDESQITNFFQLLKEKGLKYQSLTSGGDTLESVVQSYNTHEEDVVPVDAALMYNGDALAAYGGGYSPNADDYKQKIRVIVPLNPTYMLDGFVITNEIKYDTIEMDRIYNLGKNVLFKGVQTRYWIDAPVVSGNVPVNNPAPASGQVAYDRFTVDNNIFKNFDYVRYTAAYSHLNDYVMDDTNSAFDDNERFIHNTPAVDSKIDAEHITTAVSDDESNKLQAIYDAHWTDKDLNKVV